MTRSTSELADNAATGQLVATAHDHRIARLAAVAVALSAAEAAFPSPLPGIKPGIANIVVLLVLHFYGWRTAVWISLLRVVVGSILFGSFLSPGFMLSLVGATCSLAVLAATRALPAQWFGPVSQSVLSAFAHTAGQLGLAYLWLIPHPGIVYFVPLLAAAALLFGAVNGVICARLLSGEPSSDTDTLAVKGA